MNGQSIEIVKKYKYLEMWFAYNMSLKVHFEQIPTITKKPKFRTKQREKVIVSN